MCLAQNWSDSATWFVEQEFPPRAIADGKNDHLGEGRQLIHFEEVAKG